MGKKEDCWETIKQQQWNIDINSIKADFATDEQLKKRKSAADNLDIDSIQKEYETALLRSIPYALWKKIEEWGKDTGYLTTSQQSFAGFDMANTIKFNRKITDNNRKKAMTIYEIVCTNNIELLAEADELTEEQKTDLSTTVKDSTSADHGITIELIQKMVAWDKHRRILKDWQWNVMNEIISGKKTLNDRLAWGCKQNLKTLKQHGFTEE
ncbi:hypothetical protein NXX61_01660 [Bacteroides ovatus]|nr:hypothetical protein [Bacteroides ovatus]